ncbi:hypothetical protein DLAC_06498 [Tieghemostelium lacteum]|uniref:Uncharacterized protein n=1 Tax=Tieghemostelium lacteum TaxID=361077 RepID=A0A151ZEW9_TIELA|nr:hypothetical protein DLAC_06498 [Tieghemostelium lacteum]|eukprot:KYQ92508.1 hypothetical protein DLAC_06498 [Tieghemostelium lacteum]
MGRMRNPKIPTENPYLGKDKEQIISNMKTTFAMFSQGAISTEELLGFIHYCDSFDNLKLVLDALIQFLKENLKTKNILESSLLIWYHDINLISSLFNYLRRDRLLQSYFFKEFKDSSDIMMRLIYFYGNQSDSEFDEKILYTSEIQNKNNPLPIQLAILDQIRGRYIELDLDFNFLFDFMENIIEQLDAGKYTDKVFAYDIIAGYLEFLLEDCIVNRINVSEVMDKYMERFLKILSKIQSIIQVHAIKIDMKNLFYIAINKRYLYHQKSESLKHYYLSFIGSLIVLKSKTIIKILEKRFGEDLIQQAIASSYIELFESRPHLKDVKQFWVLLNLHYLRALKPNSQFFKDNLETFYTFLKETIEIPHDTLTKVIEYSILTDDYSGSTETMKFDHLRYAISVIEMNMETLISIEEFPKYFVDTLSTFSKEFNDPFGKLEDSEKFINSQGGFKKLYDYYHKNSRYCLLNSLCLTRKPGDLKHTILDQIQKSLKFIGSSSQSERFALLDCYATHRIHTLQDLEAHQDIFHIDVGISKNVLEIYSRGIFKIYDRIGKNSIPILTKTLDFAGRRYVKPVLVEFGKRFTKGEIQEVHINFVKYITKDILECMPLSRSISGLYKIHALLDASVSDYLATFLRTLKSKMAMVKGNMSGVFNMINNLSVEDKSQYESGIQSAVDIILLLISEKRLSSVAYINSVVHLQNLTRGNTSTRYIMDIVWKVEQTLNSKTFDSPKSVSVSHLFEFALSKLYLKHRLTFNRFVTELITFSSENQLDFVGKVGKHFNLLTREHLEMSIKLFPQSFTKLPMVKTVHKLDSTLDVLLDQTLLSKAIETESNVTIKKPKAKKRLKGRHPNVEEVTKDPVNVQLSDYVLKYILVFVFFDKEVDTNWKCSQLTKVSWRFRNLCSEVISNQANIPHFLTEYNNSQFNFHSKYSLVKDIHFSGVWDRMIPLADIPNIYIGLKTINLNFSSATYLLSPFHPSKLEEVHVKYTKLTYTSKVPSSLPHYLSTLFQVNHGIKKFSVHISSIDDFSSQLLTTLPILLENNKELEYLFITTPVFSAFNPLFEKIRNQYPTVRLIVECKSYTEKYGESYLHQPTQEEKKALIKGDQEFLTHTDIIKLVELPKETNIFQHLSRVSCINLTPPFMIQDCQQYLKYFNSFLETSTTLKRLKYKNILETGLYLGDMKPLYSANKLQEFSCQFIKSNAKNDVKLLNSYFEVWDKHPSLLKIKISFLTAFVLPLSKLDSFVSKLKTHSFQFNCSSIKGTLKFDRELSK